MSDIVETPSAPPISRYAKHDDDFLLDILVQVSDAEKQAKQDRLDIEAEFRQRLAQREATMYASRNYRVELKSTSKKEVIVSELFPLREIIPKDILDKGFWLETPAPFWKTNLTALKPLAKYGTVAKACLAKAIVDVPQPSKLVITEIEPAQINVTASAPTELAA